MAVYSSILETAYDDNIRAECQRYKSGRDQELSDKYANANDLNTLNQILSLTRSRMGRANMVASQIDKFNDAKENNKPFYNKRIERDYISNGVTANDARDTYNWYKNFLQKVESGVRTFQK